MRTSRPIDGARRRRLAAAFAASLLLVAGCAAPPAGGSPPPASAAPVDAADAAVRSVLAPTGALRVAVYPGSPTSLVRREGQPDRGVTVELGREMARRLGVPAEWRVYPRVAEVIAALQRGEADITLTNATPERAALLDFTPPLLALELGLLVPAGSALQAVDGAASFDRAGLRVGVSQGSSSERVLKAQLKQAAVVTLPTLQAAREALAAGQLQAFATNKGILYELQPQLPGSTVLPGRWGLEHLALGTGKGRDTAAPWLQRFAAAVQREGLVQAAAERAGLRGTAAPSAR